MHYYIYIRTFKRIHTVLVKYEIKMGDQGRCIVTAKNALHKLLNL